MQSSERDSAVQIWKSCVLGDAPVWGGSGGVDAESWDCWNTAPRPRPPPWGPAAGKAVQPRPRGTGTGFLGPCIDQSRVQTVAGTELWPRGRHLSSAEIPLPWGLSARCLLGSQLTTVLKGAPGGGAGLGVESYLSGHLLSSSSL